jgi:transposase InsO family protein
MRMHKNLGHPSNDRLSRALQTSGARPEVVQAALEIRCAICAANAPPKHSRPASLKPMLDFNHKIYMDGITWTNQHGKTFHLYHVLDAGTNYHIAIGPPSKTKDAVQMISQHWISWAGPPQELVVDSGTELQSHEFSSFTQRFGIKCQTTCPEAHWQSGRVESHGGFL